MTEIQRLMQSEPGLDGVQAYHAIQCRNLMERSYKRGSWEKFCNEINKPRPRDPAVWTTG